MTDGLKRMRAYFRNWPEALLFSTAVSVYMDHLDTYRGEERKVSRKGPMCMYRSREQGRRRNV